MSKKNFDNSSSYGKIMVLMGIILLGPLSVLPFFPEEKNYMWAFLIPAFLSILCGFVTNLILGHRAVNSEEVYTMKTASMEVLFIWFYGFFLGALPFCFGNQLSFIGALFESVSGWTTTGLSVMYVDRIPSIYLFYRGYMQFVGGLGFVMIIVMFVQGKQSMGLFNAEGHPDKLVPNLKKTARVIFIMYFSFLLIGIILYTIFEMNLLDSIVHAMCALSTGGFSNEVDSIGAYDSVYIEGITVFLMIIGTTNFAVLLLLTKGKIRQVLKVSEVKFMFGLIGFFVPLLSAVLAFTTYTRVGEGVRHAIFNVVSALSTSGFSTVSYTEWPASTHAILILLMIIGGGIGSTAGGIKMTRVYIAMRVMRGNLKKRISSGRYVQNLYFYKSQGKTYIDRELEGETISFILFYLFIFFCGSFLVTITENVGFTEAMFDFASSLGTVGLSIGITNPNTKDLTLIVEIIGMILGRLEIFIVLLGIMFSFNSILQKVSKIRIKIHG